MSVDKFIEVSTAMPIANNKDRFLSEGDIVLFSHAPNPLEARDELHCLAIRRGVACVDMAFRAGEHRQMM